MDPITFTVLGSKDDPHTVTISEREGSTDLRITCTCPAAEYGNYCQHRIDVLYGDYERVVEVSGFDPSQGSPIPDLIGGSELERQVDDFVAKKEAFEKAESDLSKAKKSLKRILKSAAL